jgi:replicative DNA helicase
MTFTNQGAYIARVVANPDILKTHPVTVDHFHGLHRRAIVAIADEVSKGGDTLEVVGRIRARLPKEKYLHRLPHLDEISFLDLDHLVMDLEEDHRQNQIKECLAEFDRTKAQEHVNKEDLQSTLSRLSVLTNTNESQNYIIETADMRAEAYAEIVGATEREYVPTGFTTLDNFLTGLEPSSLYYVAGRPGAGKTAFGVQVSMYAASQGKRVLFNSAEMGWEQLIRRMFGMLSGVDTTAIRNRTLTTEDEISLSKAASHDLFKNLAVISRHARKFETFYAEAVRRNDRQGVDLVVLDYLQLMRMKTRSPKWEELGDISNGLKELAKEIKAPVLAMTQLNRENVKENEPPQLHHLRGSGDLEQAADVVLALHAPTVPARPVPYPVDNPSRCYSHDLHAHDHHLHRRKREILCLRSLLKTSSPSRPPTLAGTSPRLSRSSSPASAGRWPPRSAR